MMGKLWADKVKDVGNPKNAFNLPKYLFGFPLKRIEYNYE